MPGYPHVLQEPSNFRDYVANKGENWHIYSQGSVDIFVNRTQYPWINVLYITADPASHISMEKRPSKSSVHEGVNDILQEQAGT